MLKVLMLTLLAAGAPEKPKLAMLDLTAAGGVDPKVAGALSEAVTQEVARRGFFSVVSAQEIRTLLGFERQKQLLGRSRENVAAAVAALRVAPLQGERHRPGERRELDAGSREALLAQHPA